MTDIIAISFAACLTNNLVLDGMLGIAPAVAVSKKIDVAIGMSAAMIFTLVIAALICYPVQYYLLLPLQLEYLRLISFIVVVSVAVLLTLKLLKKRLPVLSKQIALFLPLTLINTAVLGAVLFNVQADHGLLGSLFFALGSGLGFAVVLLMLAAIQQRIGLADIAAPFKGPAITLITLGILSMAFMGFIGIGAR